MHSQYLSEEVFPSKIFNDIPLNQDESDKINHFNQKGINQSVTLVNASDFDEYLSNGILPLRSKNDVSRDVVTSSLEATDKQNFTWRGRFIDGSGEAILISTNGLVYGQIRHELGTFKLISIKEGVSLLLDLDTEVVNGWQFCNNESESQKTKEENQIIDNLKSVTHCDNIRVLVMYTEAAQAEQGGQQAVIETAGIGITQINNAFKNSDIDGNVQLVGVQLLPDFNEEDLGLQQVLENYQEDGAAARIALSKALQCRKGLILT